MRYKLFHKIQPTVMKLLLSYIVLQSSSSAKGPFIHYCFASNNMAMWRWSGILHPKAQIENTIPSQSVVVKHSLTLWIIGNKYAS